MEKVELEHVVFSNINMLLKSKILLDYLVITYFVLTKPNNLDNKYKFFVGFPSIFDCKMNDKYLTGDSRHWR